MDLIASLGQLDNTIVVFTSDHGYWYGEHGLNDERRLAYEESIRIPLLIRYPKTIKPGSKSGLMVQSIDLAPTILEMTGTSAANRFDGVSLVPIFNGRVRDWRTSLFVEYYSDTVFPRIYKMGYKAVRTERYKYIRYEELEGMDELYDLQEDPYEMKNLAQSPNEAPVLSNMQKLLQR